MLRPETVQAVATDVDGTILRSDGQLSEATVRAAARLHAAGIPIIVASARTAPIPRIAVLHPYISMLVCSNGSIGYEPASGRELWRIELPAPSVEEIITALAKHAPDSGIGVLVGRSWVLNEHFRAARGQWPSSDHRVGTTAELIKSPGNAMLVCHASIPAPALQELLLDAGIGAEIATISWAAPDVLDISPPNTDKGTGLAKAFDLSGIDARRTIAFGDAANDVPMFRLVGHAVAMGNAWPDARAAADDVTVDVDDDGVALYLERIGLISGGT